MEKLIFVSCPKSDIEQLLMVNYLKKYIPSKAAIFYISPYSYEGWSGQRSDGYKEKSFAENIATSTKTVPYSLGATISSEDMLRGSYNNLWRWMNDFSYQHIDTVVLVVPGFVLPKIYSGSYLFHKEIKGFEKSITTLNEYTIGLIDFGEQYWKTGNFFVQPLTDNRFLYINDIPWQLKPTGFSSMKSGEYAKHVVDKLILQWMSVAGKHTSRAKNVRRRVLNKMKNIAHYVTYPKVVATTAA